MFIAERDRQYAILQDVKKCEASCDYLISDNLAYAGRFLCEKYNSKPHDNSNISRCRAEVNKLMEKLEAVKDKLLHMMIVF